MLQGCEDYTGLCYTPVRRTRLEVVRAWMLSWRRAMRTVPVEVAGRSAPWCRRWPIIQLLNRLYLTSKLDYYDDWG